jgi:RsiW-degrading membrane proteinase PrsW (M82 family)
MLASAPSRDPLVDERSMKGHVCEACGAQADESFCPMCGRDVRFGPRTWQDGLYLGRGAPLYRRAPRDVWELMPLLLAPFKHLDAIKPATWRLIVLIVALGVIPLAGLSIFPGYLAFWTIGLYFSFVWALVFGALLAPSTTNWRLELTSYFGTAFIGVPLLYLALLLNLQALRTPFLSDHVSLVSVFAFIVFVGVPEELTKALVLFAIWRWAKLPGLRTFVLYGLLSGLGFGISEGIHYQLGVNLTAAQKASDFAGYYFANVLRLTSLPLLHAVWTGIAAFLIWFAARVPPLRAGFIVLAILVPAIYHGTYDAIEDALPWLGLLVMTVSIVSLAIYTASAEQLEAWLAIGARVSGNAEPARPKKPAADS